MIRILFLFFFSLFTFLFYFPPYSFFPSLKFPSLFLPFLFFFFSLSLSHLFSFFLLPFSFSLTDVFIGREKLTPVLFGIYKFRVRVCIAFWRVLIFSLTLLRLMIISVKLVLTLTLPVFLFYNGDGIAGFFPPDIMPPTGPRVRLKIAI